MTEQPKRPSRKHNPAWADNTRKERNSRHFKERKERTEFLADALGFHLPPARLVTPLPCSIRADTETGLCLKPAYVAYVEVYNDPVTPGRYLIQPVCEACAKAAAAVYEDKP